MGRDVLILSWVNINQQTPWRDTTLCLSAVEVGETKSLPDDHQLEQQSQGGAQQIRKMIDHCQESRMLDISTLESFLKPTYNCWVLLCIDSKVQSTVKYNLQKSWKNWSQLLMLALPSQKWKIPPNKAHTYNPIRLPVRLHRLGLLATQPLEAGYCGILLPGQLAPVSHMCHGQVTWDSFGQKGHLTIMRDL